MFGTGLLNSGTRIVFRTGNPLVGSLSRVPFLNDRMAFIHASLVLYMKLPSIQLVTRLICTRGTTVSG